MSFIYLDSRDDYVKFIHDVQYKFGCNEDWESFFGFNLKWDEETGEVLESIFDYKGEIEYCPNSFPAIVYYLFDSGKDRMGDFGLRIIDFVTTEELELKV